MKVFNSRHSFALWCASELCKSPILSKMYKKAFRKAKLDCEASGKKFNFDDFVIRYYLFYEGLGKPKFGDL